VPLCSSKPTPSPAAPATPTTTSAKTPFNRLDLAGLSQRACTAGTDLTGCNYTPWTHHAGKIAKHVAKRTTKVVAHAAVSMGQFIARNKGTIALVVIGTVAIGAGTVLTFGLADAMLAAGAGLAEEGGTAAGFEIIHLTIDAPLILGPGLTLAGAGGYTVCRGVRFC
jgi:hypothetical protein